MGGREGGGERARGMEGEKEVARVRCEGGRRGGGKEEGRERGREREREGGGGREGGSGGGGGSVETLLGRSGWRNGETSPARASTPSPASVWRIKKFPAGAEITKYQ